MINGIGAADSYYPIANVGTFYCKDCRKEQDFQLMELKMKIRILYIPTVPINTKYAVVCPKCKSGYYVEEYVKNNIVAGKTKVNVTSEGLKLIEEKAESLSIDTIPVIETKVTEEHEKADEIHQPEVVDSHTQETINTLKRMALEQTDDEHNDNSDSITITDFTDNTDSENNDGELSDENSSSDTNTHTTGLDFNISEIDLPRIIRKQCPTCGMFFREDTDSCPICCCELVVKEYKIGKE